MAWDWSTPIRADETRDFAEVTAWMYTRVVEWMDAVRHDPIAREHWKSCQQALDRDPYPRTPDAFNDRWREFIVGVWSTLLLAHQRQQHAAQASAQALLRRLRSGGGAHAQLG